MNKIDELMALFDAVFSYQSDTDACDKARIEFRQALEAALKPGKPIYQTQMLGTKLWYDQGHLDYEYHKKCGHTCRVVYTAAPPAQTPPPRLTVGILNSAYRESFGLIDSRLVGDQIKFARAIETAVRKQFGVTE
jgi:hypothetical protein